MMFIDGGSRGNPGISGCGVYDVISKKGYYFYIGNDKTNNEAEYSALIFALEINKEKNLIITSDSKLLVSQIQGQMQIKAKNLLPLFNKAKQMISKLNSFQIKHTLREGNKIADQLANKAMNLKQNGFDF